MRAGGAARLGLAERALNRRVLPRCKKLAHKLHFLYYVCVNSGEASRYRRGVGFIVPTPMSNTPRACWQRPRRTSTRFPVIFNTGFMHVVTPLVRIFRKLIDREGRSLVRGVLFLLFVFIRYPTGNA